MCFLKIFTVDNPNESETVTYSIVIMYSCHVGN